MIVGIVRTKMFAVILGTFGVGIISQLLTFYQFIVLVSSAGITLGLTKFVSEWEKDGLWDEIKLVIGQSSTLLMIISFVAVSIISIYSKDISLLLLQNDTYYLLIIFLSFSIPLALISALFDSFIKGLKLFKNYLIISIVSAVISLIANIVLVYYLQLFGAVLALSITAIISIFSFFVFFIRSKLLRFSDIFSLNFKYSKKFKLLISLAFAYLFVGSIELLSQMVIRSLIIKYFGISSNGIYQSIYNLSMSYFSILFMSLGVYLLPTLSAMKDRTLVNLEINHTLRLTFTIVVPLLTFVYVFREYIIIILYSKEFLPSTDLLFYSLAGDYFRAFTGVIGTWLVPDSRIKAWITMSMLYYFGFVILFVLFVYFFNLGLKSVVVAYFISNVIAAVLNLIYIIKENHFRFSTINFKLFSISIIFVLSMLVVSGYSQKLGIFLYLPIMLVWIYVAFTKEEFSRSLDYLKLNFRRIKK